METVKRIAMISTALGWLVNHIPTAAVPVELLPVLAVAKTLVPIIGMCVILPISLLLKRCRLHWRVYFMVLVDCERLR